MKSKRVAILLIWIMSLTVLSPTVPFLVSQWQQWKDARDVARFIQHQTDFDDPYLKALIKRAAPVKHASSKVVIQAPHYVFVKNLTEHYSVTDPTIQLLSKKVPGDLPELYSFLYSTRIFHPPSMGV